jgi:thiamine-phosphate pyrophosphorylase
MVDVMQNRGIDYSLYLVTDRRLSLGRPLLEVIKSAVEGGVTVVQLREKELDSREFYEEGLRIKMFLKTCHIPLIINDRVDIALAIDADGVHLGQDDLPLSIVRKLLGPDKLIGVSVFTPDDARRAEEMGADYLGLSPIFLTSTKPELINQIGIEGIRPIREATSLPIIGIGSLDETNVFSVVCAGLDGVAVVSGICAKPDVRAASEKIKQEVLRAKDFSLNNPSRKVRDQRSI